MKIRRTKTLSAKDKFTPSEAKAFDALTDTFHLVKALNEEEKVNIKEVIFILLKQSYPDDFLEIENIQLNFKDNVGYESVV